MRNVFFFSEGVIAHGVKVFLTNFHFFGSDVVFGDSGNVKARAVQEFFVVGKVGYFFYCAVVVVAERNRFFDQTCVADLLERRFWFRVRGGGLDWGINFEIFERDLAGCVEV